MGSTLRLAVGLALLLASVNAVSGELEPAGPPGSGKYLVYVGTYTQKESKGIYAYRFDAATGDVTALGLAAESREPSFLAIHPNRRFLYAVNEVEDFGGEKTGAVSAFAVDAASGKLRLLNQVASRGAHPAHIAVDRSGRYVLAANYTGGSVASFPVLEDGGLGEAAGFVQHRGSSVHPERQLSPHAHSITMAPHNDFAVAADLGVDEVIVYSFDQGTGRLARHEPGTVKVKPGAGPRHFTFHPGGRLAYVLNELDATVTAFAWKNGGLSALGTYPALPASFAGEGHSAEVLVHPNGRFLYASNRGPNDIAVFMIAKDGRLAKLENVSTQGEAPRNFAIDPTGKYLFAANQRSDEIVLFRIDQQTGRLTPTGAKVKAPSPVCVVFVAVE